ncbi:MAG TPA: FAD-binding oxidoreductase [Thermoleophilaceae bacterium]|jgi:sarcosine oxidase subunit beta
MSGLPSRAGVVVAGGGVIGASIAFHLAEAGVEGVLLVERAELGSGSTGRGAGGVRAMFSDELNVSIGVRSLERWGEFGERPGGEIDLARVGYLFLLDRPEDVSAFERDVAMQNRLGLPSRMLATAEAGELSPLAGLDGVLGAAFCPLAGHATPDATVQGYAAGARRHGASIATRCEVTGVQTEDGAIAAVETSRGTVATEALVCAAGVGSAAIGAMAGVDLPVTAERRRIAYTGPIDGTPERIPMTIDFATGFYFHREGPGLLFGTNSTAEAETDWLEHAEPVIARRAPVLAEAPIAGGWSGLYEMSPDHNALIGEAAGPSRFLYATGFSGHGFQQAPAVGEIVRDLYLGREPFVDVSPLTVERAARPERNVV